MTRFTNSNNVKLMLGFISFVVVVLFCLIAAFAFESCWLGEFASFDSIRNSVASFGFLREFHLALGFYSLVFFGAIILCDCSLSLFSLAIVGFYFLFAFFTPIVVPVRSVFLSVKFTEKFNLLAFATNLRYNCFRHSLISNIKLCLKPVTGTIPRLACFILRGAYFNVKYNISRVF